MTPVSVEVVLQTRPCRRRSGTQQQVSTFQLLVAPVTRVAHCPKRWSMRSHCLEEEGGEVGVGVVVGIEGFSPLGQKVLEGEGSSRQRVGTLLDELPAWYPHAFACDSMLYAM